VNGNNLEVTKMKTPDQSRFAGRKFYAGAIALSLATIVLPACTTPEPEATAPEVEEDVVAGDTTTATEDNIELDELTGNVEEYVGQTVTVRADALETVGESSFVLQDDDWFGGEEVLILNTTGSTFVLPPGEETEVQATGEVRELVIADVEEEYGIELDPDLYVEYENQPVIIADSLALSPDPAQVSANPEAFYNQTLAFEADIEEVLAPDVFKLDEDQFFGGEGLLVLQSEATPAVEEGETVTVTGVLRPFIRTEIEQDYDYTWDDEVVRQIEAEYNQEPVLVAEEVYPSAD
jgi:hypothetical protein